MNKLMASLLGVGYIRPFSASWGSLASGLLLYSFWPQLDLLIKVALTLVVFLMGVKISDDICRKEKLHDPHFIVIDELVGMMIVTMFIGTFWADWLLAFVLFRIFDVAKLWPASIYDKRPGGFAIMMDDVIMALPALGLLHILIVFA